MTPIEDPPDLLPGIGVLVERWQLGEGTRFEAHVHEVPQLVWAGSGVVAVVVEEQTWVLPPTLGLWMPAQVEHTTAVTRRAAMYGVYLRPSLCAGTPSAPVVVAVSSLASELIELLVDRDLDPPTRSAAESLLLRLLRPVSAASIPLPLPRDDRARQVAMGVLDEPSAAVDLRAWGRRVGASERTLARLFVAETGCTFGRWRTLARLHLALTMLADGASMTAVALAVGYRSPSAFGAAFRQATGTTPGRFFATGTADTAEVVGPATRAVGPATSSGVPHS